MLLINLLYIIKNMEHKSHDDFYYDYVIKNMK